MNQCSCDLVIQSIFFLFKSQFRVEFPSKINLQFLFQSDFPPTNDFEEVFLDKISLKDVASLILRPLRSGRRCRKPEGADPQESVRRSGQGLLVASEERSRQPQEIGGQRRRGSRNRRNNKVSYKILISCFNFTLNFNYEYVNIFA